MLAISMQALQEAAKGTRILLIFALDHGYYTDVEAVAMEFLGPFGCIVRHPTNSGYGNSVNVLEAVKMASHIADRCGASLIHVIEEDVQVKPDYFRVAEEVHRQWRPFAFSGCMCHNDNGQVIAPIFPDWTRPCHVYQNGYYQSLAVSMTPETIRKYVLPHANSRYYTDPIGYVKANFPESRFGVRRFEQDGLINRAMEEVGGECYYLFAPCARHFGAYGYNRGARRPAQFHSGLPWPTIPLSERVKYVESLTARHLNDMADKYKDFHDPMYTPSWRWRKLRECPPPDDPRNDLPTTTNDPLSES